eukprot:scaffold33282_cov72-Skeletonema_dohrnii-CCMP3373.AAC.1
MDVLNRRGTRIALAVAPVIAIAVVLGVLFGRKDGSNAGGETPPPPEDAFRSSITTSPSGMPSVAITEPPKVVQCPIGEKEFILKYSNRGNDDSQRRRHRRLDTPPQQQQQQQRSLTEFSTWYVKDACTGEKIVSCIPCPSLISQASASLSPVATAVTSSSLAPTPGIYKVSQSSSSSSPPTAGSTSSSPVATTAVVHHDTTSYHIKNNDRYLQNNNEQLIIVPNTQQILQEASRECIP